MKRLLLAAALPAAAASGALAFLISAGYRMPAVVSSNGGGNAAAPSYQLTAGMGAPAGGQSSSAGYRMTAGVTPAIVPQSPRGIHLDVAVGGTEEFLSPLGQRAVLTIPPYAFSQNSDVNVDFVTSDIPGPDSDLGVLQGTGLAVKITNDKGLQLLKPLTLTIHYRDSDVAGLDESKFRISVYRSDGKWTPLPSTPNPAVNTVTAKLPHLSLFQVMQLAPAAALGQASAFPNPMRPARGHAYMTLANMPPEAHIRILTLAGELVRELYTDASGQAQWDGRNGEGEDAASGVYLAFLQKGSARRTIRVAVER